MKLILTENIDNLGVVGKEVDVAVGYARNYLLPKKMAVHATEHNRLMLARKRLEVEERLVKEVEQARRFAQRLEGLSCTIGAKVSEGARLYGSVSVKDILAALSAKGIDVERTMVRLNEPIKSLGVFKVPIRLHKDVQPEISVEVVAQE